MKRKPVNDRCCMNPDCPLHGQFGKGNIIRHSFYKTCQGRRRRYLCKVCKKTFGSTAGTPYYRLQKSRATFDEVATMAVEGVGILATARIKNLAPDTVAHWREKAAKHADRFNDKNLKGFDLTELQADEMRTFVDTKLKPIWVLTLVLPENSIRPGFIADGLMEDSFWSLGRWLGVDGITKSEPVLPESFIEK